MPYLGRDWRSSGLFWVKNNRQGKWDNFKMCRFEFLLRLNETISQRHYQRFYEQNVTECYKHIQPNVYIPPSNSSLIKLCRYSLIDVFKKLDFFKAMQNVSKFRYSYEVIMNLLNNYYNGLSIQTQKFLFSLIELAVHFVIETGTNVNLADRLLLQASKTLSRNKSSYLSRSKAFHDNGKILYILTLKLQKYHLKPIETSDKNHLNKLPYDIIEVIIQKLENISDIDNFLIACGINNTLQYRMHIFDKQSVNLKEMKSVYSIANLISTSEKSNVPDNIWKYLINTHYPTHEIATVLQMECLPNPTFKVLYSKLQR
ncbi:hypothetical protein A3Q56_01851 [Intoshia linei]|uniref:F-box domain-containing protein n=1 Tax=Intoshia linei TaxID=1819745 RepID=A0A177B9S2_9BILA|nr:hypothetical protein A3Q56_01851 [Intoshia linei]